MKGKENHFVIIYGKEGKEEEERKKEKKKRNEMKQETDEQKQMIRKDTVSFSLENIIEYH